MGNFVVTEYDDAGRATKIIREEDEEADEDFVVEYAYDDDGHLTQMAERGGGTDAP